MQKKDFFELAARDGLALTFDDVRLETGYSEVLPDQVNVESRFSRNVPLKVPIVSAAMDTVTEYQLAIAMAKAGGLGVIHRSFSPEQQAKQVARVKHHMNGFIEKPVSVFEDQTIESILQGRAEKGFTFHSFPVHDREKRFVGILTENDFDFCNNAQLTAREVMTREVISAPAGTCMDDAYNLMVKYKKKAIPLVDAEGRVAGLYIFRDIKRIRSGMFAMHNLDAKGQLRVGAAIGVGDDAFERLELLVNEHVDVVVVDTAHGDTKSVLETLRAIRKKYTVDVVVGNISHHASAMHLLDAGADGIKIGQGPGSICTTRIIAGIGCPQVTAVYRCAVVGQECGVPVCADGGITSSGDIVIALAAGAASVMLGNLLAGIEESPGELVFLQGRQWKKYRGMGSIGAMQESRGARQRYSQGERVLIPEGVEGMVPFKGPLDAVMAQYVGGVRSGMGYIGAKTIAELQAKAEFFRTTAAGRRESHPHDIVITRDAPNYSPPQGERQ